MVSNQKEYLKEYYQNNKDKFKEYQLKNKDKIKQYKKGHYQKNRDKILKQTKQYKLNNKDKHLKHKLKWSLNNKDKIKEYYQKNKGKVNLRYKNRYRQDKNFAIKDRLRKLLRQALRLYTTTGKYQTSKKYGINYKAIIEHLTPFPEDISKFHIDHIKPLCSFNLTDPEEIKKAFEPNNHQWLLAEENLSKGGRF